jgi:hypothetical protein
VYPLVGYGQEFVPRSPAMICIAIAVGSNCLVKDMLSSRTLIAPSVAYQLALTALTMDPREDGAH